ncbi:hypothetical protein N9H70_04355 [Pseudomonadales bacterium]|nr:hypothetical protein [Pseudomonadales bacterium]
MLAFSLLMLFCLCFPYVTPISFGTDVQPWGVFFAIVLSTILLFKGYRFKSIFILFFAPVIASVLLFPFSDHPFSATRSIAGYISIALIPLVFHYMLRSNYENTIKFLKFAVIVYLAVALIQTFVDANFLSFVLNRMVGSGGARGVNSLSSEPTFYGLICLFLLLTVSALEMTHKNKYICLLLFQIIFLAQSSLAILLLLIFVFFYALFNLEVRSLFVGFLVFIVMVYIVSMSDMEARFIHLVRQLMSNPEAILLDGSINSRIGNVYFSLKGFLDSYGVPNGFSAFPDYWSSEIVKQDILFQSAPSAPIRIMSFYGAMLFELGLIGALIPVAYSIIIFKAYKDNVRQVLILIFSINAILFTAVPMSFSLVGMYFGALIYKAENRVSAYSSATKLRYA